MERGGLPVVMIVPVRERRMTSPAAWGALPSNRAGQREPLLKELEEGRSALYQETHDTWEEVAE